MLFFLAHIPQEALVIAGLVLTSLVLFYWAYVSYYKTHDSFHEVTDKEILELIAKQPDGLLSLDLLTKYSSLSKSAARKRLSSLSMQGIIGPSHTSKLKSFYYLKEEIKEGPYPTLSSHPFLSLGDLMLLFKHFDYKLTVQSICIVTNLPVAVILREIKYFEKEKVIERLTQTITSADGMSGVTRKFYILNEPYRNNPDAYLEKEEQFNLDLDKMYREVESKRKA